MTKPPAPRASRLRVSEDMPQADRYIYVYVYMYVCIYIDIYRYIDINISGRSSDACLRQIAFDA